jgi:4-hydroxy-tetrahydrodipicolinate reductase
MAATAAATVKVAIAGATGRMGQMLMRAVADESCYVAEAFGRGDDAEYAIASADVLIDFTNPEATLQFLPMCIEHGTAMVIGTTGFEPPQRNQIEQAAAHIPILLAANTGVGVNVVLRLVEVAARALGVTTDIEISEAHHRNKVDAPSGTALMLAHVAARARGQDSENVIVSGDRRGARIPGSIGISALRAGDIVGEHTVYFTLEGERIEITHRAQSREVFARGALRAAAFLAGKTAGLYTMNDVLKLA